LYLLVLLQQLVPGKIGCGVAELRTPHQGNLTDMDNLRGASALKAAKSKVRRGEAAA